MGGRSERHSGLGQVRAPYRSAHIFFSSAVPPLVLDAIRSCPLLVGALRSLKEVRAVGPHLQPDNVGALARYPGATLSCNLTALHVYMTLLSQQKVACKVMGAGYKLLQDLVPRSGLAPGGSLLRPSVHADAVACPVQAACWA